MVEKGATANGAGRQRAMGPDTIVLDDDDKPVEPGSGVVGRMARGGNVPLGYYKDPEKTAATFVTVDGKRYSVPGDFATVEADGTMTLLGRGSVCINSGGEKIYPEEVEAGAQEPPGGVRRPRGRRARRALGPAGRRRRRSRGPGDTPTLEELAEHCRDHARRLQGAARAPPRRPIQRQPSGKPDYPWAKAVAEKAPA